MSSEKKERKPEKLSFEELISISKEIFFRDGVHMPTLIVQGRKEEDVTPPVFFPKVNEERLDLIYKAGFDIVQKDMIGRLEEIFFVSEGWIRMIEGKETSTMPPSQDSGRIEVLQITGIDIAKGERVQLMLFEIVRDQKGDFVDLNELGHLIFDEKSRFKSPPISAFLDGYIKGIAQQN